MNQLATRELTLLGLGAVAVVLMLTTLALSGSSRLKKIHSRDFTVDGMPRFLIPAMSIVRLDRDASVPCHQAAL
jgi:hypothetical protein